MAAPFCATRYRSTKSLRQFGAKSSRTLASIRGSSPTSASRWPRRSPDAWLTRDRRVHDACAHRGVAPVQVDARTFAHIDAHARLLPAGPEFITGRRGEVWLTDLAENQQQLQVSCPKGGCTLVLAVPASPDGAPGKIGSLACEKGKP